MTVPDPDSDWERHLRFHGLGPALLVAPVGDLLVTLHASEYDIYEWVVRGPQTFVQGALEHQGWEALQLGREELILGIAPEGAVAAEARVGELGEAVPVHLEPRAYWLVVPLAREVVLTFYDGSGDVVWEQRISGWHRSHPLPIRDRPEDFRLSLMAQYRLGEPLAVLQVGGEEVSIHRQEGVPPSPFGDEGGAFGEPVGTLWGISYEAHEHGGGGGAGPLTTEGEDGRPVTSDPGCMHVGEEWRVFAGSLPAESTSAEVRVGQTDTAPVELAPEIFYTVVPSSQPAVVTIWDAESRELTRHELAPWEPPWRGGHPRMDPLAWLRMRLDMYLPFARKPGYQYWYGPLGRRTAVRVPEESETLRGTPPDLPKREPATDSRLPIIAVALVAVLLVAGLLLRRAVRGRQRG